ncbi:uncharacterized protein LDX57_001458 [Aspergillus melleus]|uniref:uncharacterized protein n=1 Tax=Aspergillus melleus TaxID=138277 RepID=UPI001E8CB4FB|nr:uncharacterized protein LDX57_001458 [Aspergillus melleus]KAH8423701.1 hypothetical protein LDX57_001458 [Aspergillus melleus]
MNRADFLGLSSQEPHRVVSFPASQSLHASTASATAISTGLARLDEALCPSSPDDFPGLAGKDSKGISQGHVTEVFGPPGVGKTSLALSIASNALRTGGKVVWIDTGSPLPKPRLKDFLSSRTSSNPSSSSPYPSPCNTDSIPDLSQNLLYIHARTLPHLLSLLHRPPSSFPPPNTTLLVIDSISAPFQPYYPAPSDLKARLSTTRIDKSQQSWLVNRKWNVTSDLAAQLSRLATTNHMAVLALNQTHTRIRGLPQATLTPVVAGGGWETAVFARVGLYRDFVREGSQYQGRYSGGEEEGERQRSRLRRVRFAEVMKRNGKAVMVRREEDTVVPFLIELDGLHALDEPGPSPSYLVTTAQNPDEAPKLISGPDVGPTQALESEAGEEPEVGQNPEHNPEQELEQEPEQEQTLHDGGQEEPSEPLDATTRKRKVDEIADSQDEDSDGEFGWNEDDDVGLLERE